MIGTPRVPWDAKGTFDGISNFRLDRRGKIYEHQVRHAMFSMHSLRMKQRRRCVECTLAP